VRLLILVLALAVTVVITARAQSTAPPYSCRLLYDETEEMRDGGL